MAGKIEARLAELGIELPTPAAPAANYIPYTVSGNLVLISGQITFWNGALQYTGKVGVDLTVDDAYKAARVCGLNLLVQLRDACGGELDRVRKVLRLEGFVSAGSDFTDHPRIINGASDLMVEVFGDAGRHARFAVGTPALPLDSAVEVAGIFEID